MRGRFSWFAVVLALACLLFSTSTAFAAPWDDNPGLGYIRGLVTDSEDDDIAVVFTPYDGEFGGQVLRTPDGGSTWLRAQSGIFGTVYGAVDGPSGMWAGEWEYLWRSLDSGATWSRVHEFTDHSRPRSIVMPHGDPDSIYALADYDNSGTVRLHVTHDGGTTWAGRTVTAGRNLEGAGGLAVSSDGSRVLAGTLNKLYVGGVYKEGGLYVSTNGGFAWSYGFEDKSITSCAFTPGSDDRCFVVASGELWASSDGGGTWTRILDLPGGSLTTVVALESGAVIAGGGDYGDPGYVWASSDGENWVKLGDLPSDVSCMAASASESYVYVGTRMTGVFRMDVPSAASHASDSAFAPESSEEDATGEATRTAELDGAAQPATPTVGRESPAIEPTTTAGEEVDSDPEDEGGNRPWQIATLAALALGALGLGGWAVRSRMASGS